jgi:hypothetical protein
VAAPSGEDAREGPGYGLPAGAFRFPGPAAEALVMPTAQLKLSEGRPHVVIVVDDARIHALLRSVVIKPTRDVVRFKMSVASEGDR